MFASRRFVGALAAVALPLTGGCLELAGQSDQTMVAPERAVVTRAGNGGAATIFLPATDGRGPVALCTAGATVCPECRAAAAKYFVTGVLDPTCTLSGATRSVTTLVPPTGGHN